MALNAHRPVLCSFLYPPRCISHVRSFTSSPRTLAANQPKTPRQASMVVEAKKQMRGDFAGQNDFGLLPDTLVMPRYGQLPGLFSEPGRRWKLEKARLKKRFLDYGALMWYKWLLVKKPNPRPVLEQAKLGRIAQELHHEMYSAFAEGDQPALRKICAQGLLDTFEGRIRKRPKGEKWEWTAEQYVGAPRVMSHRSTVIPDMEQSALRQAVVRIRSKQKLERRGTAAARKDKKAARQVQEDGAKTVEEFLVLQKMMISGVEGPWIVWGTTQESDLNEVLAD